MEFGGDKMEDIIVIDSLEYQYDKQKKIFSSLSVTLKKGSFTTIVGPNGSGKTTLAKILFGLLKSKNEIIIDNLLLCPNNMKAIRKNIGIAFEYPLFPFTSKTVIEEIGKEIETKTDQEKWTKVKEISKTVDIENILECNPKQLSIGEQQIVSLVKIVVTNPKILILDDALTMIDERKKQKILKYLNTINQEEKTTILNITHDLEESLYGKDILLLQDGKVKLYDKKEKVLNQETILKKAGLRLPFLADLSIRLMYYGVLDHMILDMDEMVNTIWK